MASVYLRGDRWWCRLKDEAGKWISRPTEFAASDKRKALRYATAAQKKLDERRGAGDEGATGPHTVRSFSRVWLKERRERGVRSVDKEESRIRHHLLPRLGSMRHGEVAGLRWRHYDAELEPLGRLLVATSYDSGRTKTDVTRRVPVHPTLAKILAAWKLSHWERIYGRAPGVDDLIVPARTMGPIAASDGAKMFKEDLRQLGLRTSAGEFRDRGGHDLRAWFITSCQEHGAHRDLLRVVTHTAKGDIVSGYTRATWAALCAEVGKLKVSVLDGKLLELATDFATAERKHRNRWSNFVGVVGIEPTTCTV